MPVARDAYIGLGSNLDDPLAQVARAVEEIAALPGLDVSACSRPYSSPPMGPPDQPHYINAVVHARWRGSSDELLDRLQGIERAHGRIRDGVRWGPRTLDLDMLLFGDCEIDNERLHVPHRGLEEREFVVLPLADIAPTLVLPNGLPIARLAAAMRPNASATRLDDWPAGTGGSAITFRGADDQR